MNEMRIYVASLYDYNDGRLEGKWFDLSDYPDASDLMTAIQEMLEDITKKYDDGEVREEWAVHDYEGIPSTLASEYMGEQDFQKLYDIDIVAQEFGIPFEVLVERAGDTGVDDYDGYRSLADSLMLVVDGNDESDIVSEYEDQIGGFGYDFWSNHIYIDDVTERVLYSEDVDRFREDILYENPDLDEDEAERQAEEMADEEAERREDLASYLQSMGYDDIPDFVSKDYEGAWKRSLTYDFDVIYHDGQMYVFSNNYSLGGTILSGLIGAYIGYKVGRAKPQKKGFSTEKRIGRKIKGALTKKKMAKGGGVSYIKTWEVIGINKFGKMFKEKITLGRMSDKEDVKNALRRRTDLNIREITSIKEVFGEGGGLYDAHHANMAYLNSISASEKMQIFKNIANHYGISVEDAEEEVTYDYAEYLYEYITDKALRMKVYNAMKSNRYAKGGGVDGDLYFAIVRNPSDKNYWKLGWSTSDTSFRDTDGREYDKLYFAGSKNAKKYYLDDINYLRDLEEFTATSSRENGINFLLARELFNGYRYYIINLDDKSIFTESSNIDSIKQEIRRLTNGKNFYGKKGVNFGQGGGVGSLKKGDKITLLGDEYVFVKLEKDNSQGYEEERILLKSSDGDIKSYPKDMVEAYSMYAKGGGVGSEDTFANLLNNYGFKKQRGAYGISVFYHKPTNTYVQYDLKLRQLSVDDVDLPFSIRHLIETLDSKGFKSNNYIDYWRNFSKYAKGGGIGFKALSAKVAKRYEGKKPEAKYRAEYGKRYSKSEAKEVGDKVAGKVYWQQQGRKMETGGGVDGLYTKYLITEYQLEDDKKITFEYDSYEDARIEFNNLIEKTLQEHRATREFNTYLITLEGYVEGKGYEYISDYEFEDKYNRDDEYAQGGGVKKRSLKSVVHLVDWKGEGIKKWYIRSYPTDDLGEEINDTITFKDLWDGLHQKQNVYEIIGVDDSLVRERLFQYLSLIYNVNYSYIYDLWLSSDNYAQGGGISGLNDLIRG